jgi:hypothetical protein
MYGSVMQHVIGERFGHDLEKANRQPRLDTRCDRELARHHRAPALSSWRALVALVSIS